ncbi:YolD-like family protein [Brevibacillus daliensis]|uniref:YolD-like family protein n=1 Tax=Brevibacillus daliensis TaxID=2892995 RepID=UPI001E545498|nr:YolD-like family protein [Brevibacillus daliensis]
MNRNKTTSKKENLFAASRFVLPEHREVYLRMKEAQTRYLPPALDEEERAQISEIMYQGFIEKKPVLIRYYDRDGEHDLKGKPVHFDPVSQRFKLQVAEGNTWLDCTVLLRAELQDE